MLIRTGATPASASRRVARLTMMLAGSWSMGSMPSSVKHGLRTCVNLCSAALKSSRQIDSTTSPAKAVGELHVAVGRQGVATNLVYAAARGVRGRELAPAGAVAAVIRGSSRFQAALRQAHS